MHPNLLGIAGVILGLDGLAYGVRSEMARWKQRHWIFTSLISLRILIQGPNEREVLARIDTMLDFLEPPNAKVVDFDGWSL